MARKKILWICSWYPSEAAPFNGDFIQRQAAAAALFNDIYVIYAEGFPANQYPKPVRTIVQQEGLTEHRVLFPRRYSFWGKFWANYKWFFFIRQAIRRYMVENGKPDLVHIHIPYKAAAAGRWIQKRYKIPYLLTEHWGIYNEVERLNFAGRSSLFKRFTRQAFIGALHCISVSRYLAEGVRRLVAPVDFSIVPNVADTRLFFYKERRRTAQFRFIHVSNMVPLKNTDGILRAFSRLLQLGAIAELVMVGNADDQPVQMAQSLGLDMTQVRFMGEISYSAFAGAMQEADCLLLFSNIENAPCVISEAACTGLPVIATRVGGIPELTDRTNAILVEPGDETALLAAMQQMIGQYDRYNQSGIANTATARFSYAAIGQQLDALYEQWKQTPAKGSAI